MQLFLSMDLGGSHVKNYCYILVLHTIVVKRLYSHACLLLLFIFFLFLKIFNFNFFRAKLNSELQ